MVAVGDYNFDWDIPSNGVEHDQGLDLITADDRFKWIQPEPPLVRTQCSSSFNSILDFVFTTAKARTWDASSRIPVHGRGLLHAGPRPDERPPAAAGEVRDPVRTVSAAVD
jgi:hypothetical protein